jgi:succinoglycan biosynthesis transport protein ExoP
VERKLNLPVLGVIPQLSDLANMQDPTAPSGEPYRVLQTNLNLALRAGEPTALVMLSSGPGEGKSTTMRQLALSMAAAGERVLLIDSDVRRPTQHKLADLPKDPGLTDVVLNKLGWTDAVRRDKSGLFDFIPSGGSTNVTLSLLYANKLRELVGEFKQRYDKVLFDSPPIIGVSDASVIASISDGVVLLIQHRRNPESMVQRARQIIESLKVPVIGVVLNQVPSGSGDDYSYYTNNYSYYSHDQASAKPKSSSGRVAERIDLSEKSDRKR